MTPGEKIAKRCGCGGTLADDEMRMLAADIDRLLARDRAASIRALQRMHDNRIEVSAKWGIVLSIEALRGRARKGKAAK